jgi:predicted nuclease of restriction endonuclease-like (RecB) superfamily
MNQNLNILNNQHKYAPIQDSMQLIKTCKKGWHMNITENLYIQLYHRQHLLISEQCVAEENPLFQFINLTPPTTAITQPPETDATP